MNEPSISVNCHLRDDTPVSTINVGNSQLCVRIGTYALGLFGTPEQLTRVLTEALDQVRPPAPDLYVVFDGPPSHESGRFVEVEDAHGASVGPSTTGAEWSEHGDLWRLGPFTASVKAEAEEAPAPVTTPEPYDPDDEPF